MEKQYVAITLLVKRVQKHQNHLIETIELAVDGIVIRGCSLQAINIKFQKLVIGVIQCLI